MRRLLGLPLPRRSRLPLLALLAIGCDDGASTPAQAAPADAALADARLDAAPIDAGVADATPDRAVAADMQAVDAAPDLGADAAPDAFIDPGYADPARWLCHPQHPSDPCREGLDATAVAADGTLTPLPHPVAVDPPVDCLYVYPTTSVDPGGNSDRLANDEERFIVHEQAGRFSQVCRVFAPIYRQVTVTGLLARNPEHWALALGDVEAAWEHYRAENPDRPVILIGHSQGASHLRSLIAERIDPDPAARDLLVAAYLIGSSVGVPPGEVVGGSFAHLPLCTTADAPGCVVSYASFRQSDPPGENSLFAGPVRGGLRSACVNPAALVGDPAALDGYYPTAVRGFFGSFLGEDPSPWADPAAHPAFPTPHFTLPGLVAGACVSEGSFDYLQITVAGDPADPRVDDIIGDFSPGWGLHLADMHLVMGDLVRLAARQTAAWLTPR